MVKKLQIFLLILFCSFNLSAGKIKKGFQALDIYNYFSAKQLFEKSMKKDGVAAAYGLSIIYLRDDNPFFNLDSAHHYATYAANNYSQVKLKKKLKYAELKVDSLRILEQRDEVSKALFKRTKLNHTIASYQRFLDTNPWSVHVDSVIYFRDNLGFDQAVEANTASSFKDYLLKFPNSERKTEAQSAFDRLNYQEQTAANNFIDYVSFTKNFPDSPYYPDAEDQVYRIYTKTGSLESYKNFIANYSQNRNVPIAWKKMFNTYLQDDYSTSSIQSFMEEFEEYPFKEELLELLNSVNQELYPIKERNKWGYMTLENQMVIKPMFEVAEDFHEGLAIIQLEGKYGFVNKTGEVVIDPIFDDAYKMNEGHAVVEIDEKWGLINRSGEFVIQPEFEDLGNLNEGLCYFSSEENYGYFDRKGIVRLKEKYTTADDFNTGKAIVSVQGNYGLIDVFGTTSIPFKYERLKRYGDSTYLGKFNNGWGILDEAGDTIVGFIYDFIGAMNDNRAIVEKEDAFNYIDENGDLILEEWIETYPEYRQFAAFTNQHAKIEYEDGYNLIDTLGNPVFKSNKEELGDFSSYIAVKKGDKWGYLNKKGATVIPFNYTMATSFEGKLAKAGGAPLVGIIDKSGTYSVEPYFEQIDFLNDSLLIVKSRGNFGILSVTGDTLINFKYISVEPFSPDVVQLETREAIYYYHIGLNKYIRKED